MADTSRLGPWVRRFLLEHLIKERNLSRGTQQSYRDTLTLLIPFAARKIRTSIDAMKLTHISADIVRLFLLHPEQSRGCTISTRNQRQAALHSLARFVALHSPEHEPAAAWLTYLRFIDRSAVLIQPLADSSEDARRIFGDRSVRLWPDIQ